MMKQVSIMILTYGWRSLPPHDPVSQYRHNVGEDNADGHVKRTITGRGVVVASTNGKL